MNAMPLPLVTITFHDYTPDIMRLFCITKFIIDRVNCYLFLDLTMNGAHIRQTIMNTLHELIDFSLKQREDDTKSLVTICQIYHLLIFHRGEEKVHIRHF
jgi:hypothetical protein